MQHFLGKWQLKENIDLGSFLTYYQYGWLKRKSALMSNIDIIIEQHSENSFKRTIDSTFMKSEELYILDDQFRENDMELLKKHVMNNNMIISSVKSIENSSLNLIWVETANINKDGNLIIKRNWIENRVQQECKQIFVKA